MNVLYFNSQSLINKIDELRSTVIDLDPDIICVCETWTRSDIDNAYLNIDNFQIISRIDRKDTTRGIGGGLLIYAKTSLNVTELNAEYLNEFNQCAAITLKTESELLNICLVYRPHNTYDSSSVDENNANLCRILKQLPKPFVIVGDFNYSDINWKNGTYTSKSKDFFQSFEDNFLTQHVDFPTHKSGTMPDLVISSNENFISSTENVGSLGSSDHSLILTEINLFYKLDKDERIVLDWNKADFAKIRTELSNVNWQSLFCNKDVDDVWCIFKKKLNLSLTSMCPKKRLDLLADQFG